MTGSQQRSAVVRLKARPHGPATPQDFSIDEEILPEPGDGEVLLRTRWLSIDPLARILIDEHPLGQKASAVALGGVIPGAVVGEVAVSRDPRLPEGSFATGRLGWRSSGIIRADQLDRLDLPEDRLSSALGLSGLPGLTAYVAIDHAQITSDTTILISGASGSVGAIAGQLARLRGARVVGLAGGERKCRYLLDELGFDAAIDHRAPDLADRLAAALPDGCDAYIENVGAPMLTAALPTMRAFGRVIISGLMAHYIDKGDRAGPDRLPLLLETMMAKRLQLRAFNNRDHIASHEARFLAEMDEHVRAGRVTLRERVYEGLGQAPQALADMFANDDFGKIVVRVA